MTANPTAPVETTAGMTHAHCAHLLRTIERHITLDRLPAPRSVSVQPEFGAADLRFAADDVTAVQQWADRTGAALAHDIVTHTRPGDRSRWHVYGTRSGGERGRLAGWHVDLWCTVDAPAPTTLAGE